MNTATPTDCDPVAELAAAVKLGRQLATQARADLTTAVPILVAALRHSSGQSAKIERILWSIWNDDHQVNLSDCLSGLDARLAQAVVAMISGRAHMAGDADELLRTIITESGSQPPTIFTP